ncbi:extracellular solute-binding protein [Jiella sp. MQZ9-1]|uniref:Extracellular solute-binding protein n=1 Tax=Jiella flava TaxID=2816857 RepID=A0A939FWN7_9HYPH|nr:extracellular solute-binding protein [Jiella flava]MBO0662892.1 extracellular solute-binding protein [Jiella flava]MCD2471348.1 extracellular solute-binding protein [Jiella flava]
MRFDTADRTSRGDARSAPAVRRTRPALRVLGTSVTQIEPIKAASKKALGVALDFITLDGTAAQRRCALEPGSFDVYDQWFHDVDLIWPTGSIQPIDLTRIIRWDEINDLPKKGRLTPGSARAPGGDPSLRLFVQADGSLGEAPSQRVSLVPTVHNADGFAVAGAEAGVVTSWGALLDPRWAGKVVLQSDAAIGSLDLLLALVARGEFSPGAIDDLSLEEIDALTALIGVYRSRGHFRQFWADEAEALDAICEGNPTIGSLWWSGLTNLRARGQTVSMVIPGEGCRGWFGGLGLSADLNDWQRDAAYDYLNWWLEGEAGALMARNGAYMSNPAAVKPYLTPAEWAFWYEGRPAEEPICDAFGRHIYAVGERREGGSYAERMERIVVWDTVMTEHNYFVRKWEAALGH